MHAIDFMEQNPSLIAPCGMDCRICIGFFGYTLSGRERKIVCPGCRPRERSCAFLIKRCARLSNHTVEFCYECPRFPCSDLQRLDRRYREHFGMSMVENLEFIRDHGMHRFLTQQEKRYNCPVCGGTVCVHTKRCYTCDPIK
jgi:hypothetical protein